MPWHWFVTLTFPHEIHPEAADKLFRVWSRQVNQCAFGTASRKDPARQMVYARGTERQKRGVIHYHAVAFNTGFVGRREAMELWHQYSGGIARIYAPDEIGNVCAYVTKYVVKGGEIDLSANFAIAAHLAAQRHL